MVDQGPAPGGQPTAPQHRRTLPLVAAWITAVVCLGAAAAIGVLYVRASDAERAATIEASRARAVAAFLQDMFDTHGPADVTVRELLETASARVGGELMGQPQVEAAVRRALGRSCRALGLNEQAESQFRRALELGRGQWGATHPEVIAATAELGSVLVGLRRFDEAEPLLREALTGPRSAADTSGAGGAGDALLRAQLTQDLAGCAAARGDRDEALRLCALALELRRRHAVAGSPEIAETLLAMGKLRRERGELDAAEAALVEAEAIDRSLDGGAPLRVAAVLDSRAQVRRDRGDLDGTEVLLREALELRTAALGAQDRAVTDSRAQLLAVVVARNDLAGALPMAMDLVEDHRREVASGGGGGGGSGVDDAALALALSDLGQIRFRRGAYATAAVAFREALELRRRAHDPDPAANPGESAEQKAVAAFNLASALRGTGELTEAGVLLAESLASWELLHGPGHPYVLQARAALAGVAADRGEWAAALMTLRSVLEAAEKSPGPDHPDTQVIRTSLGAVLGALGRYTESEELCRTALRGFESAYGDAPHPAVAAAMITLAETLREQGKDLDEAMGLVDRAIEIDRGALGETHPDLAAALERKARLLAEAGDLDGAVASVDAAIKVAGAALGAEHRRMSLLLTTLGRIRVLTDDDVAAEATLRYALERCRETLGPAHPATGEAARALGRVLYKRGQLPEAEALCHEAQAIALRSLPAGHHDDARATLLLGLILVKQGNNKAAGPLLEQAMRSWPAVSDPKRLP